MRRNGDGDDDVAGATGRPHTLTLERICWPVVIRRIFTSTSLPVGRCTRVLEPLAVFRQCDGQVTAISDRATLRRIFRLD